LGGREQESISRKSALWNAGLQLAPPLLGLPLALVAWQAKVAPTAVFVATCVLYVVGFALFLAAKISVFRAGSYFSVGSQSMASWARRAYRTGYLLMGLACVGAVGFMIAWR